MKCPKCGKKMKPTPVIDGHRVGTQQGWYCPNPKCPKNVSRANG